MPQPVVIAALDQQPWLDTVSATVQPALTKTLQSGGPLGQRIQDVLHGTWLGHPLHSVLTDIPLGAWSAALVLDGMEIMTGRAAFGRGADTAITVGLVGAVGAALTGATDWQHTDHRARRIGLMHGLLNTVGAALFATSRVQRSRRQRTAGRWLALIGYAIVGGAAYLGGHLVYGERLGVDHSAGYAGPERFVPVLAEAELPEGQMRRVDVEGTPVLLARQQGTIYALIDACSHLGGPLSAGALAEGAVRCPWHGSCFALANGRVLNGPATHPQPCFETRVQQGQIEIRAYRRT